MTDEERAAYSKGWKDAIWAAIRGINRRQQANPNRVRSRRIEAQEIADMVGSLMSQMECDQRRTENPKAHVSIACVVGPGGHWNAIGWSTADTAEEQMQAAIAGLDLVGEAQYWIEAYVDIPESRIVQGVASNSVQPVPSPTEGEDG